MVTNRLSLRCLVGNSNFVRVNRQLLLVASRVPTPMPIPIRFSPIQALSFSTSTTTNDNTDTAAPAPPGPVWSPWAELRRGQVLRMHLQFWLKRNDVEQVLSLVTTMDREGEATAEDFHKVLCFFLSRKSDVQLWKFLPRALEKIRQDDEQAKQAANENPAPTEKSAEEKKKTKLSRRVQRRQRAYAGDSDFFFTLDSADVGAEAETNDGADADAQSQGVQKSRMGIETCHSMLRLCFNTGAWAEAANIFRWLQTETNPLRTPTLATWWVVLEGLAERIPLAAMTFDTEHTYDALLLPMQKSEVKKLDGVESSVSNTDTAANQRSKKKVEQEVDEEDVDAFAETEGTSRGGKEGREGENFNANATICLRVAQEFDELSIKGIVEIYFSSFLPLFVYPQKQRRKPNKQSNKNSNCRR